MRMRSAAALAAMAMVAACAPRPAPPAPSPPPPPEAPPPAPPPPSPPPADWALAPLSPGDWTYAEGPGEPLSGATFRSGSVSFVLRCGRDRSILIGIAGARVPAFTIRTTYGERRLPATSVRSDALLAALPANDLLFDQMAFSRGRLLVEAEAGVALVVPAWPEIARVAEDCRGA